MAMPRPSHLKGFTLLELLTVIIIFTFLLGLAVVFMRGAATDVGVEAAAHHVAGQIWAAQRFARRDYRIIVFTIDQFGGT